MGYCPQLDTTIPETWPLDHYINRWGVEQILGLCKFLHIIGVE